MIIRQQVFHTFLGLCLSFFVAGNCFATMYKWVDEDGNTHYSEKPPAGDVEVETIKPPPKVDTDSAVKAFEEQKGEEARQEEAESKAAEEQANKDKDLALMKSNCETAKKNLESITANPRVFTRDEQGNRVRMGEEQRQAKIEAAKKDIAEFCK